MQYLATAAIDATTDRGGSARATVSRRDASILQQYSHCTKQYIHNDIRLQDQSPSNLHED